MSADSSEKLQFLPLGLNLQGKSCLIVGGGDVGTRKVHTLVRTGAAVTVVSPSVTDQLAEQVEAGRVRWVKDTFREEHLGDAFLVVAATDDDALNATVARLGVRSGALVCDASSAERSQVIFGALLDSEETTVAVFSGGRDPALARRTRDRIAVLLGRERPSESRPGTD